MNPSNSFFYIYTDSQRLRYLFLSPLEIPLRSLKCIPKSLQNITRDSKIDVERKSLFAESLLIEILLNGDTWTLEILCDRKLKRISDFSSDNRIISVMLYRNFPSNTLFLRIHAYIRIYMYISIRIEKGTKSVKGERDRVERKYYTRGSWWRGGETGTEEKGSEGGRSYQHRHRISRAS